MILLNGAEPGLSISPGVILTESEPRISGYCLLIADKSLMVKICFSLDSNTATSRFTYALNINCPIYKLWRTHNQYRSGNEKVSSDKQLLSTREPSQSRGLGSLSSGIGDIGEARRVSACCWGSNL